MWLFWGLQSRLRPFGLRGGNRAVQNEMGITSLVMMRLQKDGKSVGWKTQRAANSRSL